MERRWNPADYIGYSEKHGITGNKADDTRMATAMARAIQEMNPKSVVQEQEAVMGATPENAEYRKEMLLMKMGIPSENQMKMQQEADQKFYATPAKQKLMNELGIKSQNGIPLLDARDESLLDESLSLEDSKQTLRQKMLNELLGDK